MSNQTILSQLSDELHNYDPNTFKFFVEICNIMQNIDVIKFLND